jgi:hypothetical protein
MLMSQVTAINCNYRVQADSQTNTPGLDQQCQLNQASTSGSPFVACIQYRLVGYARITQGVDLQEYQSTLSFVQQNPSFYADFASCSSNNCISCDFQSQTTSSPTASQATKSPTIPADLKCNTRFVAAVSSVTSSSPCTANTLTLGATAACVRYSTSSGTFTSAASAEELEVLEVSSQGDRV